MSADTPKINVVECVQHTLQQNGNNTTTPSTFRELNLTDLLSRANAPANAAVEEDEYGEERSGLRFSTTTRPYTSEDSCPIGLSAEYDTHTCSNRPGACAAAGASTRMQEEVEGEKKRQTKEPAVALQQLPEPRVVLKTFITATPAFFSSSTLEGSCLPAPQVKDMSANVSSSQRSSIDGQLGMAAHYPSLSPLLSVGSQYCSNEFSDTRTSLAAISTSHGCDMASTALEGDSAVPSITIKPSTSPAMLQSASSDGNLLPCSYLVRGCEEDALRVPHIFFPSISQFERSTSRGAPPKTSAYMRFERAVQDKSWSCDAGRKEEGAAVQSFRAEAMLAAAEAMSMVS
ncbi:hypothetical protein ABL78_3936 [Leptomonas seymouri]|uniref:Uncharacterized protein n=1 Tax=Leptomonas seymouri TaxID=5684 RepID=A0A0N1PDG2_LEPSE|nr:hypothetical protein ABL78_3936 [Leptomonas seymouri]|eukprot:KPI86983.1 hypothetical protein ABL78_3936 [Leptomonas seymouri]